MTNEEEDMCDGDPPASQNGSLTPTPSSYGLQDVPSSSTNRRALTSDADYQMPAPHPPTRAEVFQTTMSRPIKNGLKRLSMSGRSNVAMSVLTSASTSPPTPAPSPGPYQRMPSWSIAEEEEERSLRSAREHFTSLSRNARKKFLAELLNMCDSEELSAVRQIVDPKLKKDPFEHLPDELCLRVLCYIDDPRSLIRASQVSKRWHKILSDDMLWKVMCDKHAYMKGPQNADSINSSRTIQHPYFQFHSRAKRSLEGTALSASSSAPDLLGPRDPPIPISPTLKSRRKPLSTAHFNHFRHKFLLETAWRKGGTSIIKHITPDQGVVTSLHLTSKYIIVAMDNAKIHVFNVYGDHQKTLRGHVMGVWAMVPWDDILVSGGCDRDVRVWNMATGDGIWQLRGHTSTVRCLRMADSKTAISGSRDTTLRVWDLETGTCKNVLSGHQASVRCLAIHGDMVVSGSYDTTAKLWSISEGRCLKTFTGHFSQIYAIAFDGQRIATGSLDTSVRVWDAAKGTCDHVLQGHTSLVGQLQMRGNILVTGGSDGSVRVWSLTSYQAIHRLAAHDNSVTSLQFDENRIVSGGSDGRVKIWSLETGQLVRELSAPAEAVWRVAFEEEKCVVMASRNQRTVMEVWSFTPPETTPTQPYTRPGSSASVCIPAKSTRIPILSSNEDTDMTDATPVTSEAERESAIAVGQ